jgi:negative regulator of flagellin synthesis FlgM
MKISDIQQQTDAMQYVNQTNKQNPTEKKQTLQEADERSRQSSTDKVELSAESKEMQKIYEILKSTPDVRAEKVSELKKQVQEDSYQVDSGAVAEKMIKDSLLDLIK